MTLKEIAQSLNVSPATVSLVMNGKPGVGADTRSRVLQMLRDQGYEAKPFSAPVPPTASRQKSIRFFKYTSNGYLVHGNDGFVTSIIDAIEIEARRLGYALVMTSCQETMLDEVFSIIRENPLDGMILIGTEFMPQHYHYLDHLNVPVIAVDNYMHYCPIDSVSMNNRDTVYTALSFLHSLGHRQIGYLQSRFQTPNFMERYEAYRSALEQLGMTFSTDFVYHVGATVESSHEDMNELLRQGRKFPTALFADNDTIAIGCIHALERNGVRIPGDISVIGFDDIPSCKIIEPPLTTMRSSPEYLGFNAVRQLHARINNPNLPVTKIQCNGELICRKSTQKRSDDSHQTR